MALPAPCHTVCPRRGGFPLPAPSPDGAPPAALWGSRPRERARLPGRGTRTLRRRTARCAGAQCLSAPRCALREPSVCGCVWAWFPGTVVFLVGDGFSGKCPQPVCVGVGTSEWAPVRHFTGIKTFTDVFQMIINTEYKLYVQYYSN